MRLIVLTSYLISIILVFLSNRSFSEGKSSVDLVFRQIINQPLAIPGIVINEIMFDPEPSAGLPAVEYIELYNPAGEPVHIGGWRLNNSVLPDFLLSPGSYVILSETKNAGLFKERGISLGLENWDRLNNQGQTVTLADQYGQPVDQIAYSPDMIADPVKKKGGWSLELINPHHTCKGKDNWAVSDDPLGGTPGKVNSVYSLSKDDQPPEIRTHYFIGKDSMVIIFSEPIILSDLPEKPLIEFTPHLTIKAIISYGLDSKKILVELGSQIMPGIVYKLKLSKVSDCLGNVMNDTIIQTGIGKSPDFADLLFTEIMFDETPSHGMPDTEYVEILNVSEQLLDLSHFRLIAREDTIPLPGQTLLPGTHYILCPARNSSLFAEPANTIGITGFPRLLNEGMTIALINEKNKLIHSVFYSKEWYNNQEKSTGGFSIELIDPGNPCGDRKNWGVTENENGGTPGKINSIRAPNPDLAGPEIESAYTPDDRSLWIRMNERLHPGSIETIFLHFDPSSDFEFNFSDPLLHQKLEVKLSQELITKQRYIIEITGIRDCVGNKINKAHNRSFFYLPEEADSGDLAISEILFNPEPGGVDWIEIYNLSEKYIDPNKLTLGRKRNNEIITSGSGILLHRLIFPRQYYVFTSSTDKLMADFPFSNREQIYEVKKIPEMPDQAGNLILMDTGSLIFDYIEYSSNMHHPMIRNDEGVSLERINFDKSALSPDNWESASFVNGYGTPTKKNGNSQEIQSAGHQITVYPEVFSPDGDGYLDLLTIRYKLSSPGYLANVFVFNIQGRAIKKLTANNLMGIEGIIYWDGSTDTGSTAGTGYYIILFELYDLTGNYDVIKKKVGLFNK